MVSNQLALVSQADNYLDLDQKIQDNYIKNKNEIGWAKQTQKAAKIPPNVLFGLQRSDSMKMPSCNHTNALRVQRIKTG